MFSGVSRLSAISNVHFAAILCYGHAVAMATGKQYRKNDAIFCSCYINLTCVLKFTTCAKNHYPPGNHHARHF